MSRPSTPAATDVTPMAWLPEQTSSSSSDDVLTVGVRSAAPRAAAEVFTVYQAGGRVDYLGGGFDQLSCTLEAVDTVVAVRSSSLYFSISHSYPEFKAGQPAIYASLEMVVKDSYGATVAVSAYGIGDQGGSTPINPSLSTGAFYGQCNVFHPEEWWCVMHPGTNLCNDIDIPSSESSPSSQSGSSPSSQSSSSYSSSSSVKPRGYGISYWQIFQWPDVFIVGWQPEQSSASSETSSSSSITTGYMCFEYFASGFSAAAANGCYHRTGAYENERPVFSNGVYLLKFGGEAYPRWYLQNISTFAIHYWSLVDALPTNGGYAYTAQIGLGVGGTIVCDCPSSSSESSVSSKSEFSSYSSRSSLSTPSSRSSLSSSSSSYYKNLPVELASYVSTCRGMSAVTNPATGAAAGVMVRNRLDEVSFPERPDMTVMGGLVRTTANGGWVDCLDASRLFSMSYGMVKVTLNAPQGIENGVYASVDGRENSANPDMVLFAVNPGESYVSPPGLYAAMTPSGIEFTVWSDGSKVTVTDTTTTVAADTDVTVIFAWDYSRKILVGDQRASVAIVVDGTVTAWASDPIIPGKLDAIYGLRHVVVASSSSESDEPVPARFSLGDVPSGKNGLVGIVIRKIETYREPYGIAKALTPSVATIQPLVKPSVMDMILPMTVEATRWATVSTHEPSFTPAETIPVVLTKSGNAPARVDLGAVEDETYPETPAGLPPGIEEVRERP